jgi:hypothetical protein
VAILAALRWTNWCLRSCCVPESDILGVMPIGPPGSVPLSPGWGGCVTMIRWCRIGVEDDNEKKCKFLKNIYFGTSQNEISICQVAHFTQLESCCVWLQIAGVPNRSAICNLSARCCVFVAWDSEPSMTLEISRLYDINNICFPGKDIWWCLSQEIPGILHETEAKNRVIMYC